MPIALYFVSHVNIIHNNFIQNNRKQNLSLKKKKKRSTIADEEMNTLSYRSIFFINMNFK